MDLKALSPIPIGVINRRNGCGSTVAVQRLRQVPSSLGYVRRSIQDVIDMHGI
ncbi:MAG: hypothetical protein PHG79_00575 [Methanosarcina sp.]|nr:hypothetical protein [Methanosarcina sp.]MDD4521515.1 hypothetical protein [Methanosarcina sp.]